jgi:hypothetical protein
VEHKEAVMDIEQVADLPDTSRMTRSELVAEMTKAIAALKADARSAGLTDEDIDAELAAYNAENRGP